MTALSWAVRVVLVGGATALALMVVSFERHQRRLKAMQAEARLARTDDYVIRDVMRRKP